MMKRKDTRKSPTSRVWAESSLTNELLKTTHANKDMQANARREAGLRVNCGMIILLILTPKTRLENKSSKIINENTYNKTSSNDRLDTSYDMASAYPFTTSRLGP
jgi:hypothetical protein